jgi:hypothetical protein
MNSQCNLVLNHLQRGRSLTPAAAMHLFDIYRLAARVHDLKRRGHRIRSQRIRLSSGSYVAQYSL